MHRPAYVNAKTVIAATIMIVPMLTLLIYISGLQQHRSLYLNSLLSTTVVSIIFFCFISTGLYRGWTIQDDAASIDHYFSLWRKPREYGADLTNVDLSVEEGGVEGCIVSLVVWIVVGLFGAIIFWLLGAIVWGTVLAIAAMLYWIFLRAYRLIFGHAGRCRAQLGRSLATALLFTILYNCWIYAIILGTHYLRS